MTSGRNGTYRTSECQPVRRQRRCVIVVHRSSLGRIALLAVLVAAALVGPAEYALAGTQQGQLDPGETVDPGQSVVSPNGQWSFEMQTDGNLVLYGPRHVPVAETRTEGQPEVVLQMQLDGNLVLRARGNCPIAASGTDGYPGMAMQVQDDGAVVLYAPGHKAIRVVVPAADYVNSPMPGQPRGYVDSPTQGPSLDAGRAGGDSGEVTKTLACAGGGRAVASKIPKAGEGVDVACGILGDDSGRSVDGYEITRTIGCALFGRIGPACSILTDDDAAY